VWNVSIGTETMLTQPFD